MSIVSIYVSPSLFVGVTPSLILLFYHILQKCIVKEAYISRDIVAEKALSFVSLQALCYDVVV